MKLLHFLLPSLSNYFTLWGGGGSGGASIKLIEAADLGATITATIGTGGVGQSAGVGIAGATSSFP